MSSETGAPMEGDRGPRPPSGSKSAAGVKARPGAEAKTETEAKAKAKGGMSLEEMREYLSPDRLFELLRDQRVVNILWLMGVNLRLRRRYSTEETEGGGEKEEREGEVGPFPTPTFSEEEIERAKKDLKGLLEDLWKALPEEKARGLVALLSALMLRVEEVDKTVMVKVEIPSAFVDPDSLRIPMSRLVVLTPEDVAECFERESVERLAKSPEALRLLEILGIEVVWGEGDYVFRLRGEREISDEEEEEGKKILASMDRDLRRIVAGVASYLMWVRDDRMRLREAWRELRERAVTDTDEYLLVRRKDLSSLAYRLWGRDVAKEFAPTRLPRTRESKRLMKYWGVELLKTPSGEYVFKIDKRTLREREESGELGKALGEALPDFPIPPWL